MNKFDRILWRINGIFLLALLLFGAIPIWWNAIGLVRRPPSPPKQTALTRETIGSREKEDLYFDGLSRLTGTSIARMPLRSVISSHGSSFKSGYSEEHLRNFLYIDYSDLSSWWLFDGFGQVIVKEHDLRVESGGNDRSIVGTIFEVATTDTDGDHRVTERDRVSAFFTPANGKKPVEIIPASDRILSVDQVTNNEVLIIYQRDAAATAAVFSVQTGGKLKESALPIKLER
jgi:hypothetical protein